MKYKFSISIVSHGHKKYVKDLLLDLARLGRSDFDVILTLNLPEKLPLEINSLPYNVIVINNHFPKGFAANHNAAFLVSQGDNFVILNPDITIVSDPFDAMDSLLKLSPNAVCAPLIVNHEGKIEDSARNFPTPLFLLKKLFGKIFKYPLENEIISGDEKMLTPDWVAGMFVVVPRDIYKKLQGLSESYHMYYEDVDFCARARMAGCAILVAKDARVIHEAQRDSHRKFRYMLWHLQSAIRFFTSSAYVRIRLQRSGRI